MEGLLPNAYFDKKGLMPASAFCKTLHYLWDGNKAHSLVKIGNSPLSSYSYEWINIIASVEKNFVSGTFFFYRGSSSLFFYHTGIFNRGCIKFYRDSEWNIYYRVEANGPYNGSFDAACPLGIYAVGVVDDMSQYTELIPEKVG